MARVRFGQLDSILAVFNMVPPPGTPAELAFSVLEANSFQEAAVRSEGDFGVDIEDFTVPTGLEIQSIHEEIWGVPADPSHDAERTTATLNGQSPPTPFEGDPHPFITLPVSCTTSLRTGISIESVEEIGRLQSASAVLNAEEGEALSGLSGCNALEFKPTINSQATTNLADSPSGLDFTIHQPQNNDPEGLATASLKDAKVTLPEGMTLNPSAANGLGCLRRGARSATSPAAGKIHFSEDPPELSRRLQARHLRSQHPAARPQAAVARSTSPSPTTTLRHPAGDLPGGRRRTDRIVAKLAGKVEAEPAHRPAHRDLHRKPRAADRRHRNPFLQRPEAALKTPLTCGTKTTTTTLAPWSTPEGADANPSDSFETRRGRRLRPARAPKQTPPTSPPSPPAP